MFLTSRLEDGQDNSDSDVFLMSLQTGQRQRLTIHTLPELDGQPSVAEYSLFVLDPQGNVVASAEDLQAGGANADIVMTAAETGDYRIVIEITGGIMRYTLTRQAIDGPQVVGRNLFYNNSLADGYDVAANDADDAAIAYDKTPLLANNFVQFVNYSNYIHGINGVMVDLLDAPGPLTLDDFDFRIGNDDQPHLWNSAPPPREMTIRQGAGTAASDRVTFVWDDGTIRNEWLQITVRATPTTGLAAEEVFYFGNLIGETGDSQREILVDSLDLVGIRHFLDSATVEAPYQSRLDFNRDTKVDSQDVAIELLASRRELRPVFGVDPNLVDDVFQQGDANFDGRFDADDLLFAQQSSEYEDLFAGNSTWSEGDWDGDGDFTTSDLVLAYQRGYSL